MQCQKLKTYMETGRVVFLPARSIRPNPAQPRKVFHPEALAELAESIRCHGILQPLSVRRAEGGYELIAGERRLRAALQAGLTDIPCIIMQMDDRESGMAAMIENLQRQDLDFIEEAMGIARLMEQYQMSQEQIARLLGKSQSAVANKLRILKHSQPVLQALRDAGLRVPEDISVMGLDGLPIGEYTTPRLSTVAQPVDSLAEQSLQLLFASLEDQSVPRHETVPVTLWMRESVRNLS